MHLLNLLLVTNNQPPSPAPGYYSLYIYLSFKQHAPQFSSLRKLSESLESSSCGSFSLTKPLPPHSVSIAFVGALNDLLLGSHSSPLHLCLSVRHFPQVNGASLPERLFLPSFVALLSLFPHSTSMAFPLYLTLQTPAQVLQSSVLVPFLFYALSLGNPNHKHKFSCRAT